jgi:hypothetical protein
VLVAALLGGWLAVVSDEELLVRGNAALATTAVVLLAAGLLARVALVIPVAVALLGAAYLILLGLELDTLDSRAPLVAAALLAVAELGYWSLELQEAVADEPGTYLRRVALLSVQLAGVTTVGVILLAVVEGVETGGVAIQVVGALAAVGVLALLALAARAKTG